MEAGVAGIRQRDITHKLRNVSTVSEFMRILIMWRALGAVQKFHLSGAAHRPTTIWRATEKLRDLT